jgi:hypothetical protein
MIRTGLSAAFLWVMLVSLGAGCGPPPRFAFHKAQLSLTAQGAASLAVATHDQREYIRSDEKVRSYLGSVRKAGIPKDALTESGKPLAADVSSVLIAALAKRGFAPVPVKVMPHFTELDAVKVLMKAGQGHGLLLVIKEWHSDSKSESTKLRFDLRLSLINPHRSVVAESKLSGEKSLSGRPDIALPIAYQALLEKLVNDEKLVAALGQIDSSQAE